MNSVWITARHEFLMIFRSIYGWIALALVVVVGSYYLYLQGSQYLTVARYNPEYELGVIRHIGVSVIGTFNQVLLFLTPLLTAASISSEHRNYTIVLLQSSPISSWEIVLGKFLACLGFYLVILSVGVAMILALRWFNPLDFGHLSSIVFGSVLLLASYVAIGIYCSSLGKDYFVSMIVCLILLLIMSFVLGAVAREYSWVEWLVISGHSEKFYLGEIDTRHIAYFVLMSFAFLFLARQRLESARKG